MSKIGVGTFYLIIAQIVFLLSAYVVHFGLGRILGPNEYGIFGVILSILTVIEIFLIRGLREAVSKFVSEFPKKADYIKNQAVKLEIIFSLVLFLLMFSFAPYIAEILNDSTLEKYIRLASFIIPILSVNSIYLAYLSGKRMFGKQSVSMCAQSVAKVLFVYFLIYIGLDVFGAILGYILAAVIALSTSYYFSMNSGKALQKFSTKKLILFAFPIIVFSGAITIIMNMDLLLVKGMLANPIFTGFYTAAAAITKGPYYIFMALSFTLLPSISKSVADRNLLQTQNYITRSMRYLLLLIVPITIFVSSNATQIMRITYSEKYLPSSTSLSILIFAISLITIFYILSTIVTASGKPHYSMFFAIFLVPIHFILITSLIPIFGIDGAALGTLIVSILGVIMSGLYVRFKFKKLINLVSLVKIFAASTVIYLIPKFYYESNIYFIIYSFVIILLYFTVLYLLKEIKKEDILFVKKIIR